MPRPKKPTVEKRQVDSKALDGLMNDWTRLKELEQLIGAWQSGRRLFREIELLKQERDGWAKIAVEAQLRPTKNLKKLVKR